MIKSNVRKKEFILACGSRGLKFTMARKAAVAWVQGGMLAGHSLKDCVRFAVVISVAVTMNLLHSM